MENLSRGERTRQAIIQAAHRLFVQQGYHGTSMRQIAKKAQIALGGLYNHFDGKEDVFHAVYLEYHPYKETLPAILAAEGETIEAFVRDAIGRMIAALEDRPEFMNLMFIELVEFNSVHAHELFARLLPQTEPMIQRLVATNRERLRPIPFLMLYRMFFGLFFAYYLTELILAREAPPEFRENAVDHFVDAFLYGILKGE
jgi:AcrR family transcriptional regulator